MTNKKVSEVRQLHLDIMRIVAIFFVFFYHTRSDGFFLFSRYEPEEIRFWIYLFFSHFCKFAVPLFWAISGAVMLRREEEGLGKLWKKRILKIGFVLVLISLFYYLHYILKYGYPFDLEKYIRLLYFGTAEPHLWYLYLYLAFLMILPFERAMVRGLDDRYFIYLLKLPTPQRCVEP